MQRRMLLILVSALMALMAFSMAWANNVARIHTPTSHQAAPTNPNSSCQGCSLTSDYIGTTI